MIARVALATVMAASVAVAVVHPDCADVDRACSGEPRLAVAVSRAARAQGRCLAQRAADCDLTPALRGIDTPECRFAVECAVRSLGELAAPAGPRSVVQLLDAGLAILSRSEPPAACRTRVAATHRRTPFVLAGACAGTVVPADCFCGIAAALAMRTLAPPVRGSAPAPVLRGRPRATPGERPNVVLIVTDDQRWDTIAMSRHGRRNGQPVMPAVERLLVASGVTFTNAYVTTSTCCPSRASILTGQYAHNTGVLANNPGDGGAEHFRSASTIATWLRDAGYRTALVGKYLNGYGRESLVTPPGWGDWHAFVDAAYYRQRLSENGVVRSFGTGPRAYSTDVLANRAVRFIRDAGDEPFFLYFAPFAPHLPATPAHRHAGTFAGIAPWRPPSYAEADVSTKAQWLWPLVWERASRVRTDRERIRMLESLQAVDDAVAAIMRALDQAGQRDNTVVLFTSDNGYSWGEHRWAGKECPYEECMRVPLIVRHPGLTGAPRSDAHPVLNIDLAPTIAAIAGVVVPPGVNGRSILPLLDGSASAWRTDFLNEHWDNWIPNYALVRGPRWKYVEYWTGERELYDEVADPFELTNRVADPATAQIQTELAVRLHALQAE